MFCTTLRKRASFAPEIAGLASNIGLREHQLNSHDLDIPFGSGLDSTTGNSTMSRRLRVLLLAPPDTAETKLANTMKRISHFSSLTGGVDIVIVFLIYPSSGIGPISTKDRSMEAAETAITVEGISAYSKLQVELLNHDGISPIPILPLSKLESLSDLLRRHIANISRPQVPRKPATTSFELLKLCTAMPPMLEQTAYILSDLFRDLRDLAETCTAVTSLPISSSPSACAGVSQVSGVYDSDLGASSQSSGSTATQRLMHLRDLVGEKAYTDIVDFWKEEWTID